ncbi:MAG: flagellin lysine-N-methylase [Butyrivibrio sp.]|nr:flagellin lysine-N-methylase [Butyrivibrio sp.]
MKVLKNELFDEFKCLAGECPETCCYGWRIIVDDKTKERILEKDGIWGKCLRLSLSGPDKNYFNYDSGSCIFHGMSGLCSIQKKLGVEYMPEICRKYPREIRNYGTFATKNLDLSCIHVSNMLLSRDKRPSLIECDEEIERVRHGSNDDPQFEEIVLTSQKELIQMLKVKPQLLYDPVTMDRILHSLLAYCQYAQDTVLEHKDMKLTKDDGRPLYFYDLCKTDDMPDAGRSYFPLPIMALNRLINTQFDMQDSRPFSMINRTIEWYHHKFDLKTEIEGQKVWKSMVTDFIREDPTRMEALLRYLQYDVQQCYSEIYENYSFVHFAVSAIMHVNMFLFLMINYNRRKKLTPQKMAALLSAYERAACHNLGLQKDMYAIVCDYLPVQKMAVPISAPQTLESGSQQS